MRIGVIGLGGAKPARSRVEPREAGCHGTDPQGALMIDDRGHHTIVRETMCFVGLVVVMASRAGTVLYPVQARSERPQPQCPVVLGESRNRGASRVVAQLMTERPRPGVPLRHA